MRSGLTLQSQRWYSRISKLTRSITRIVSEIQEILSLKSDPKGWFIKSSNRVKTKTKQHNLQVKVKSYSYHNHDFIILFVVAFSTLTCWGINQPCTNNRSIFLYTCTVFFFSFFVVSVILSTFKYYYSSLLEFQAEFVHISKSWSFKLVKCIFISI